MAKINVLFFGQLAEKAGVRSRQYSGDHNLSELLKVVKNSIPELAELPLLIALNQQVVQEQDLQLQDGDEVALMPPFAGG